MANESILKNLFGTNDFITPLQQTLIKTLTREGPLTRKELVIQLSTPRTTIYDNLNYNASSKEELKNQIQKILEKGYKIEEKFLKSFYKDVFSISSPSISMTKLYARKIKDLIE